MWPEPPQLLLYVPHQHHAGRTITGVFGTCKRYLLTPPYSILLSVCQTCKYMGVDFLDFLRSGEKDIHAFAESQRRRRRRTQPNPPPDLPADAIPDPGSQP